MDEPYFVAGEGRACTKLMQAAPGMVFAKTGAEGVYCAALPREGLGIALKCDDGAGRAAEVMAAMVLASFMPAGDERSAVLDLASRPLKNWNGIEVGTIRNDRGSCRQVTVLWETVRVGKTTATLPCHVAGYRFLPTVAYDGAAFLPLKQVVGDDCCPRTFCH